MNKTILAALAAAVLLVTGGAGPARAQKELPPTEPKEDRLLAELAKGQRGSVMLGLILATPKGKTACPSAKMHVRRVGEKKKPTPIHSTMISGRPGQYEIVAVTCTSLSLSRILNGPHARFEIRGGQVINAGALRLEYDVKTEGLFASTGSGTLKKSVVAIPDERVAGARRELPKVVARAVSRPMTLVGPATVNVTMKTR